MNKTATILLRFVLGCVALVASCHTAFADIPFSYHASVAGQASSKSLAPYMLGSWNEGRYVEGNGIWQEAGFEKELDLSKRFSWSVGFDYIAGAGSKTEYDRWVEADHTWTTHSAHLPYFRLQQLFGQIKFRGVSLTAGIKYSHSKIVDDQLSSGDLTRSNNAAPIPGVAAGFIDFQDIPFTNGWVQIDGEIMYGRLTDSRFKKSEFNYYNGLETINLWYNYKRCYFRTNPTKNFHVIVGMQAAAMFGGATFTYQKGELIESDVRGFHFKDLFQAFFPREGGEAYYEGSHLGSWDLKAVYRFRDGSLLNAYFEWPWEDGSGIGRKNGFDGLWGLQYNFADKGIVTKVVAEYLDFTNQSGPIHYDPEDNPQASITGQAEGADDYYNNDFYGAYANYGMSIGSSFLVSPIYNRNGALRFLHNRARGFHIGISGNPCERVSYRAMVGYEKAGGSGRLPAYKRLETTSAMIEATSIPVKNLPGFELNLRLAFDAGKLRGSNFGAQIQLSYSGVFNLKK